MAKKIGTRTVTVTRQARVDRLDDDTPDSATHDIDGCVVLPRAVNTLGEDGKGWVVVEGRMIIAPFGSDVLADDTITCDGEDWDVDGEPGDYESKRGRGKATMFYLKRLGT